MHKNKKLIVFDLDGTLAPSKAPADAEMIELLTALLQQKLVAIIGGGRYSLFDEQILRQLPNHPELLKRLHLFPTCSTVYYRHNGEGWSQVYAKNLTADERDSIVRAFHEVFAELKYEHPTETFGDIIEDRGTQITFSALGQEIVKALGATEGIRRKEEWGRTPWRQKIADALEKKLPQFEVRRGGISSIDVTQRGIDKGYGLKQIEKELDVSLREMLFIGDAIFPGGNDYPAVTTGVEYIKISGPEETKNIIRQFL